ncbi:MAG TPA: hypothetical protein VGG75_06265 [Trebonia sp.]|jgi:hypothetical protein
MSFTTDAASVTSAAETVATTAAAADSAFAAIPVQTATNGTAFTAAQAAYKQSIGSLVAAVQAANIALGVISSQNDCHYAAEWPLDYPAAS